MSAGLLALTWTQDIPNAAHYFYRIPLVDVKCRAKLGSLVQFDSMLYQFHYVLLHSERSNINYIAPYQGIRRRFGPQDNNVIGNLGY